MSTNLAPTGIEYFDDPETSYFKEWFNSHHLNVPDIDSKDELYMYVLESLIYLAADIEFPELLKKVQSPTTKQVKITNEIIAYEMCCFYLSQLDMWLYQHNHPDRQFIMNLMIECLANIAGRAFKLRNDVLINQIYNRIEYFPTIDTYKLIAEAIAQQISWGTQKEIPSETIPPETFNLLNSEAHFFARKIIISMEAHLPALNETWSDTLLKPACFNKTIFNK